MHAAQTNTKLTFTLSVFEDTSAQRSANDITKTELQQQFRLLPSSHLSAGYSRSAFWLRIEIAPASTAQPDKLFIELDYPLLQYIELYQVSGSDNSPSIMYLGRGGSAIPIQQRVLPGTVHYFPITPADSVGYYLLRVVSSTSISIPIEIITAQQREDKIQKKYLWSGFVIGVLLLLILYNAFVALLARQKGNAIYLCFLAAILAIFISITGIGNMYLWPDNGPNMLWTIPVSLHIISISSYFFALAYFHKHTLPPTLVNGLKYLAVLSVLLLLLTGLLSYKTAVLLAVLNTLCMVFILFGVALWVYARTSFSDGLFLLGRTFVLTGGGIQFLKTYGYIPAYPATEYILFIGAILEGLVLSAGLALKTGKLEEEKELAQRNLLISKEASLAAMAAANRQLAREIAEREQAERVQKALFNISELSTGDADMHTFLKEVHQSLSALMFARNFYVAFYNKQQRVIQFPYIADEMDTDLPAPDDIISEDTLQGSWTLWILQHGEALFGDVENIVSKTGLPPRFGSIAKYWLGLPLFNEQQVYGVLCLQIYDDQPSYTEDEIRLLEYVSRHISQALQRKQYRAQLEAQVQQRTHAYRESLKQLEAMNEQLSLTDQQKQQHLEQVKALLDNAGQGFLTCNELLQLEPDYSKECLNIFNRTQLSGEIVRLLVPDNIPLQELYTEVFSEVFNPEQPATMVSTYLSLLPTELTINEQSCQVQYKKISDKQIMVILSDISEHKKLQQALLKQQEQSNFIVYALIHASEVRETLMALQQFLDKHCIVNSDVKALSQPTKHWIELYRDVHTFKGILAQINCPGLPELLHKLEDQLQLIIRQDTHVTTPPRYDVNFNEVAGKLAEVIDLLKQHLGAHFFKQEKTLPVSMSLIKQLHTALVGQGNTVLANALLQLQFKTLKEALSTHFSTTERLASQHGKILHNVVYQGDEIFLDTHLYQPLFNVLVHLFRNAVDHGIETPEERIASGKPAEARILCIAKIDTNQLSISISDDGRGIAVDNVKEQALRRGILDDSSLDSLSNEEALQLIFSEDLSTKSEITELSGRGMGLAAVKNQCNQFSASIRVSSTLGKGTRFDISLPLQQGTYFIDTSIV